MSKMRALVKSKPEKGLWMEEVDIPVCGVNDVLIKPSKTAICGTDLHIYKWDNWSQKVIKIPTILGHEYVGTVVEMGKGVTNIKIGDRVTGEGHIACGKCRNCRRGRKHICESTVGVGVNRHGAFAEYVSIPTENVLKIDSDIPDEVVSIMDPLGNATHTALSFPLLGEDIIVTGAGGPIGAMAIAICKFSGARNVVAVETNEYRCGLAYRLGADRVVNPLHNKLHDAMEDLGMVGGFDVGLECSGSPIALNQMLDNMYNGGKISLLGIQPPNTSIDWAKAIFKGLTFKGIYGREMFETWYKMEQMLLSGLEISRIVTHRFKIDDFQKGFDAMESGNCGKVILDWE